MGYVVIDCSTQLGHYWVNRGLTVRTFDLHHLIWGSVMPDGKEVFAGLNQNGLIVFIILLLVCLPLCWLPWVIDSMKAAEKK